MQKNMFFRFGRVPEQPVNFDFVEVHRVDPRGKMKLHSKELIRVSKAISVNKVLFLNQLFVFENYSKYRYSVIYIGKLFEILRHSKNAPDMLVTKYILNHITMLAFKQT